MNDFNYERMFDVNAARVGEIIECLCEFKVNEEIMKHKKVIFSGRTTVVIWEDGTKTIVKCADDDVFDKEKGYLMALFQKMTGFSKKKSSRFFNEITEEK